MYHPRKQTKRKNIITWSKVLTLDEVEILSDYLIRKADCLKGKKHLLMFDILIHTGLRANELCRLQVRHTPSVLGVDMLEVYRGKNQKDRTISISSRLADAIINYIAKHRSNTMPRHLRRSDVNQLVFYNERCKPYTPNVLYLLFRKAGENAGIPKRIHPHMFRHTFAVQALRSGVDIYTLQELLGHGDILTTTQYLRFMNTQQKELGSKLDFPIGQWRFT